MLSEIAPVEIEVPWLSLQVRRCSAEESILSKRRDRAVGSSVYDQAVDAVDTEILRRLRADGRESFADIAEHVGLSSTAVKRRVDKLVETGIIKGFTVVLGEGYPPMHLEAYLEVYCRGTVSPDTLRSTLAEVAEVTSAHTVTGAADAVIRLAASDIAALERAIEQIRETEHVDHTVTSIILTTIIDRL